MLVAFVFYDSACLPSTTEACIANVDNPVYKTTCEMMNDALKEVTRNLAHSKECIRNNVGTFTEGGLLNLFEHFNLANTSIPLCV
jgi:hypothetical protein